MLVLGGAGVRALVGSSLHGIDEQTAVRHPLSHVGGQLPSVWQQHRGPIYMAAPRHRG